MKKLERKDIPIFILLLLLFIISFLCRKNRENDIKQNNKYAICKTTKKLGSLKNSAKWYYEFEYKNKIYEGSWSHHIGYDINIGDYFLVQFSSKNPEHSKIFYEYQLKPDQIKYKNYIGDTLPMSILEYREKKDKFW